MACCSFLTFSAASQGDLGTILSFLFGGCCGDNFTGDSGVCWHTSGMLSISLSTRRMALLYLSILVTNSSHVFGPVYGPLGALV